MRDMIDVASGFQYSVNIGYDLGSDDKLKNFIPTRSALSLLEEILLSVNPASTNRARMLIGAYGKGKSHIVLTILAILMKRDIGLFEKLLPRLQENQRLWQLVQNYYESDDRILPVVISGSNTSLTQAFLLSLQRTLSDYDLLGAMPDTNYQAAVETIRRWEHDFPETFARFSDEIHEPIDTYVERLENYDVTAYEAFEAAYPKLTSGSVFNPFLGFDVAELYESVAKSLKDKGFTGIYVIYDEFSKFLEANIVNASLSDTKMLQDFAEKCNRSEKLQLHIMLISHKEIANYIDKLPKEKTDGWRGVSGRFEHIHLNNNFTQTYEIISSVIRHLEPKWGQFCDQHVHDFDALKARYAKHQLFVDAGEEIDTAIYGCFPLHPVSTFILPRLSERVAQNERTLFTFLSAEGQATLPTFLNNYHNDFTLLTPDLIYDYFEPLFKKEVYSGSIHDTYILTSTILNQIEENSLGSKIVKTISLIYILEQFERLSPTKEQIIGIYSGSYDVQKIEQAIRELIEKEYVIYIRRSNDYLRLKQTSGVDIWQKIRDLVELQAGRIVPKDVLNSSNFDNYMYPSRYNDTHEMTRFFAFQFISGSEVSIDTDWGKKSESIEADGVIYGILPGSEAELETISTLLPISSAGHDRFIFVLPKQYKDVDGTIREYAAVSHLKEQASDDPVLFDEYEVVYEDLQEVIKSFIAGFTHPESYRSKYIHDGNELSITRKSALTELMSLICDKAYGLTPVINNESVNKTTITGTANTSRSKIISALLRSELEPSLGLSGTGQEVSIMRSTLVRTGVWTEEGALPQINLHPADDRMRHMLETIEGFVLEARQAGAIGFSELYRRLTSPDYRIGLRNGLIPIYLAAVLHQYRQQTVIRDRFGSVATTADVLVQINAAPSDFTLEYLDWNPEKENYVNRLAEAFEAYVIESERAGSSYDYVANAMRRWFMALPKFSKESKVHPGGRDIGKRKQKMIAVLRQNTSGSDLLFRKLPEIFTGGESLNDVLDSIIDTKDNYDELLRELKEYLIIETQRLFLPKGEPDNGVSQTLIAIAKEWCEGLDPKSFEQLFPDGTERFLQLLKDATNDEDLLITKLAKLATGLRLDDWESTTVENYIEAIKTYIHTAREFHSSIVAETISSTSSYQVTFADDEGNSTTRRFDKVDISPRGKLLFNQVLASLDAMGHAISEQEKRQVLMEILKKLC